MRGSLVVFLIAAVVTAMPSSIDLEVRRHTLPKPVSFSKCFAEQSRVVCSPPCVTGCSCVICTNLVSLIQHPSSSNAHILHRSLVAYRRVGRAPYDKSIYVVSASKRDVTVKICWIRSPPSSTSGHQRTNRKRIDASAVIMRRKQRLMEAQRTPCGG